MRYLILLLISFSVFAEDLHIQTGTDYPAWAKAMDVAYDQSFGGHRPKLDEIEKSIAAKNKFWKLRDDNLRNWAKTAKYKIYTKELTSNGIVIGSGNEVTEYKGALLGLKRSFIDPPAPNNPPHENYCDDVFFGTYAKIYNDPTALYFVVGRYRELRGLKPMPIQKHEESEKMHLKPPESYKK